MGRHAIRPQERQSHILTSHEYYFHDLIGTIVEVYTDDVVIKSEHQQTHLDDLHQAFLHMRQHNLKMNPAKCAFGVSAGNFLGFLVHCHGIEIDENKARAIINAPPPTTKKQLELLLGKINFLRQFITNSVGKMKAFSTLLKLKDSNTFNGVQNTRKHLRISRFPS
ncbi:hypothetical protein ACFX16_032785 [Malus domestica]